jgi:hypothetical protein
MTTKQQIERYLALLRKEEIFDNEEGRMYFQSGGDCLRCFDSAVKVARQFHGSVVGYTSSKNPSAYIAEPFCDGHDFALIAHRFIVDYWAQGVGLIGGSIFDLRSERDRKEVCRLYGNRAAWEEVVLDNEKPETDSSRHDNT